MKASDSLVGELLSKASVYGQEPFFRGKKIKYTLCNGFKS